VPDLVDVGIAGAVLVPLTVHEDGRGHFAEMFRRSWLPGMREVVQANLSLSRPNVLRGLHFHRKQADYWSILSGTAFVALYDVRKGSPTEGKKAEIDMDADERRCLLIPEGVAHGFYTATGALLQYLLDQYHTGEDEFGIAWDDPDVGIAWPATAPILSDRDRSNPSLQDVLAQAPTWVAESGTT
jgi:dTDP-4-dehydrorhamnose 3,5-epimerase